MNEIGFNSKFSQLQLQHGILKEQCANQLEMFAHLKDVVGPNLKSVYMMKIGQFEHQVFELKAEIARWKRRFALRQAALNRGEQPDFLAIESTLDKEFAAYIEEVKKHIAEIKEAALVCGAERLTEEEATELRNAYLTAVKKLHPDINADQPQAAKELWNEIQRAYEEKDWSQVKFLATLVDGVVSGKTSFAASADGLAALEKACADLRARSKELAERTAKLRATVPFTYETMLEDEDLVRQRQEQLLEQIQALQACVNEYEEVWKNGQ